MFHVEHGGISNFRSFDGQVRQMKKNTSIKLALLIFFIALGLRLAYLYLFNGPMLSADAKYLFLPLASKLEAGQGYSTNTGQPCLIREPLYPFFLSLIFRGFGRNLNLVKIIQCVMGGLMCVLVYLLALRLFDPIVALGAAITVAAYPPLIYTNVDIATETLAALLLMVFMFLWVLARELDSKRYYLFAGAILGLASLTRAATQFLPALILAMALCRLPRHGVRPFIVSLYLLLGFMLTIGGWSIRNYRVSGNLILISSNGGQSLFYGSKPEFVRSGFDKYILPYNEIQSISGRAVNQAEADRLLQHAALTNLGRLLINKPFQFIAFMGRKFFRLWYATSSGYWEKHLLLLNGSLFLLALTGIFWGWHTSRSKYFAPLLILIIYFAVLHTLAFPLARYMVIVMPYVIMLAVYGVFANYDYYVRNRFSKLG
jgi:4-amino-4-deoxy-L-arabinose transferase-like glycosyltransferase